VSSTEFIVLMSIAPVGALLIAAFMLMVVRRS
jgi:hypothetical protein